MSIRPKVSVAILTYNHERYLAEALDSVVAQKTSFPFEAVVAEDCSTDRTREIVLEYYARYPDIIRPILNQSNLGADANIKNLLAACKGEYIALLEGDDAWTCTEKLQLQADILDRRPEYSICFHSVLHVFEDGSKPSVVIPPHCKPVSTIEDLLTWRGNFIPTCSAMYRVGPHSRIPDWTKEVGFADWPLHVMNARTGDIAFIPRCMGIYRAHSGGTWSTLSRYAVLERWTRAYEYMDAELERRYTDLISNAVFNWNLAYATDALEQRSSGVRDIVWKTVKLHSKTGALDKKLLLLLKYYAPFIIHAGGRAKRAISSVIGVPRKA